MVLYSHEVDFSTMALELGDCAELDCEIDFYYSDFSGISRAHY